MKWIAGFLTCLLTMTTMAQNNALYDIPLKDIDGRNVTLSPYKGRVLLLVNVASQCGNTPQYQALQKISEQYAAQGFSVLGFPCNDFAGQEPGTNEEIKQFCSSRYQITFPLFEKLHVKGRNQHPLYALLTGQQSPFPGTVKWNFGKFLINRRGEIVGRFDPAVKPDAPEVIRAITDALNAPSPIPPK